MRSSSLMRNSLYPLFAHAQFQLNEKLFVPSVCACAVPTWWEALYSLSLRMPSSSLMRSSLFPQFAYAQIQLDKKLFIPRACTGLAWWKALYSLSLRMPSSSLMSGSLLPQFMRAQFQLDDNDEKLFIPSVCACEGLAWWKTLYSLSLRMPSSTHTSSLMRSSLFPQPAHAQFQLGESLFIPSVSAWITSLKRRCCFPPLEFAQFPPEEGFYL